LAAGVLLVLLELEDVEDVEDVEAALSLLAGASALLLLSDFASPVEPEEAPLDELRLSVL
jgi:hypothetical protein